MTRWSWLPLALAVFIWTARGNEIQLDQSDTNKVGCQGMYSRKAWGGTVDPFILVKFPKTELSGDPMAGLIIYEWQDEQLIGRPSPSNSVVQDLSRAEAEVRGVDEFQDMVYFCNDGAVSLELCNATQKYEYILSVNATAKSKNQIFTQAVHLKSAEPIKYMVKKTGWYCVGTNADEGVDYKAIVEYRNAYGELPAAQIAKLPFYGGITIVYAVVGIFWGFLYFQNRSDILPVQNYITAIIVYLVVEMTLTWGYYDYQNRNGVNLGARAFMIIVAILNAGRNSFSFFLLLIVCMGYGVVKPTLGKTMIIVRWLAAAHFVFGVVYAIASLTIQPDDAGPVVLLVILPLSGTLTAFYVWTLNSLGTTMKDLMARKQHVKALMYRRLWWCILGSILVIFAFFFFNSLSFAGVGQDDFLPMHWSTRWFVLDGWLNIVYFADVLFVAYLWRPTANNRRFAMSDEISQEDDGFEIASMGDSLDEEEGGQRSADEGGNGAELPPYQSMPVRGQTAGGSINRDASPLPAPRAQQPSSSLPRQSLDGETMFAVGDEEQWSDGDSGDTPTGKKGVDEGKKLTGR